MLHGMDTGKLNSASHRVVHGGASLLAPSRLTPEVIADIEACVPLAPLHNPANLMAIKAPVKITPGLPQFASFHSAFHTTNPDVGTALRSLRRTQRWGSGATAFTGCPVWRQWGCCLKCRAPSCHGGFWPCIWATAQRFARFWTGGRLPPPSGSCRRMA